MSYKLFTDKQEIFECNIYLEGASLTQATSRIIVETKDLKLMFEGTIDKDGNCKVPIKKLNGLLKEDDSGTPAFTYHASSDLAQATGFQDLFQNIGIENYESASGYLYLYAPSSTVFVKHFISRGNIAEASDYTEENYTAGYGNTTSAVNAVQFKMDSGNIDAGVIKLYGIS